VTPDLMVARVSSLLCRAPFRLTRAIDPESFDLQPATALEDVFTIDGKSDRVHGGMGLWDVRVDRLTVRIARKTVADPHLTRARFRQTANSLIAAVVRDGAIGGGDYAVPDGAAWTVRPHARNAEYGELEVTIPVDYETDL
jgi:hypothetical protein